MVSGHDQGNRTSPVSDVCQGTSTQSISLKGESNSSTGTVCAETKEESKKLCSAPVATSDKTESEPDGRQSLAGRVRRASEQESWVELLAIIPTSTDAPCLLGARDRQRYGDPTRCSKGRHRIRFGALSPWDRWK